MWAQVLKWKGATVILKKQLYTLRCYGLNLADLIDKVSQHVGLNIGSKHTAKLAGRHDKLVWFSDSGFPAAAPFEL